MPHSGIEHQRGIQPPQPGAAILLADVVPGEAQLGQPGLQIARQRALGLLLPGKWGDVFLAKGMGHVVDRLLFLAQSKDS